MKYQFGLEKFDWVQSNLASTWLDLIFSLYLDFLFNKILFTNNLNELDSLNSNCWVSKVLDQLN